MCGPNFVGNRRRKTKNSQTYIRIGLNQVAQRFMLKTSPITYWTQYQEILLVKTKFKPICLCIIRYTMIHDTHTCIVRFMSMFDKHLRQSNFCNMIRFVSYNMYRISYYDTDDYGSNYSSTKEGNQFLHKSFEHYA